MAESLTRRFKTICIFGSTEFGKNKKYLKVAVELGITLAARKIDMVYGGDNLVLRDVIVVLANVRGSRVLGIILKGLAEKIYIIGMTTGNEL